MNFKLADDFLLKLIDRRLFPVTVTENTATFKVSFKIKYLETGLLVSMFTEEGVEVATANRDLSPNDVLEISGINALTNIQIISE